MTNQKAKTSGNKSNRLIGWLVSYAMDQRGRAFEIRAGRSFISAADLPGERAITIREDTIEAPHVALSASPRHKVVLQDIFSDAGTFLSKSGTNKESKVQGPIEIEHGDWLRIGEKTRFQVCLIDGPSR